MGEGMMDTMTDIKNITICGVGTLGGNLAENLARTSFKKLTVIDRDRVEERNLANQPYLSVDIGQPKVKALAAFLYRAARAEVTGLHKELTAGNVENLLAGSDLVVDTFDNEAARKAVTEHCCRKGICCLHAGISNDGYGEIIWNDQYKVPVGEQGEEPCEKPLNRTLSLLVISVASEVILLYQKERRKKNYTVTLKDLTICAL
jgi:molybdopterin-synthase adenylyltransferase